MFVRDFADEFLTKNGVTEQWTVQVRERSGRRGDIRVRIWHEILSDIGGSLGTLHHDHVSLALPSTGRDLYLFISYK